MTKIGYQGVPGSYSEKAVVKYFGENCQEISYDNFEEMIVATEDGEIDYSVLPIENSTTGAITRALDLLQEYKVYIIGEEYIKVDHCIIGMKYAEFDDIKQIYSHPEALKQCDKFFEKNGHIKKIAFIDTAKSVEYIKNLGDKSIAAIASKRAAEIHDLKIIKENFQDNILNTTRFVILSAKPDYTEDADKIGLYLVTKHASGSLFRVIKVFADMNVNMLKLESRPLQNKPFVYSFFIDIEGNLNDKKIADTLSMVEESCEYIKITGNYKKSR